MKEKNLEKKLKDINEEDLIWCIFIILFIIKIYSNKVERKYRITNSEQYRRMYHNLNHFTYIIAILIAIYYIYRNWNTDNRKTALITNSLSIIGLVIFIYTELKCED